ncbi:MAG: glutamyl-Q tRNA(Asp) synthetase [Oleiphilaceae bacterium]|jgi:glutamyl-Q tRNA(Asp) synthetase
MDVYRGRFAPSPTGPLHQGSLFAALISFLEARSHHGKWLLRIEDVDTQREQLGARDAIFETLKAHGLFWDETVSFQSERSAYYEKNIKLLASQNLTFKCPCSRKQLIESNGQHLNFCQALANPHESFIQTHNIKYATKFKIIDTQFKWVDNILGSLSLEHSEDFVLKRKEGFYAYQLAVVCDDIEQGITHVIRGADLLDSTPMQLALFKAFKQKPPTFGHFPILLNSQAQKLSKQTFAPAIDNSTPIKNLLDLFAMLKLPIKNKPASVDEALQIALQVWDKHYIPAIKSLKHTPTTSNYW